jgi:hypothetical protein
MANTKKRKYSLLGWIGGHKLVSFTLILIIAIAGYFAYRAIALRQNKHDFQQASATINDIYNNIVRQVGEPDNAKVASYCTRTYQEFAGYSSPTCHIDTSIIYGLNNEDDANTILKKIQSLVSTDSRSFKPTKQLSDSIKDTLVASSIYHAASDTYQAYGLKCVLNYIYDTPREIDLKVSGLNKKPFEITIGCYGPAKQQYYRLAQ